MEFTKAEGDEDTQTICFCLTEKKTRLLFFIISAVVLLSGVTMVGLGVLLSQIKWDFPQSILRYITTIQAIVIGQGVAVMVASIFAWIAARRSSLTFLYTVTAILSTVLLLQIGLTIVGRYMMGRLLMSVNGEYVSCKTCDSATFNHDVILTYCHPPIIVSGVICVLQVLQLSFPVALQNHRRSLFRRARRMLLNRAFIINRTVSAALPTTTRVGWSDDPSTTSQEILCDLGQLDVNFTSTPLVVLRDQVDGRTERRGCLPLSDSGGDMKNLPPASPTTGRRPTICEYFLEELGNAERRSTKSACVRRASSRPSATSTTALRDRCRTDGIKRTQPMARAMTRSAGNWPQQMVGDNSGQWCQRYTAKARTGNKRARTASAPAPGHRIGDKNGWRQAREVTSQRRIGNSQSKVELRVKSSTKVGKSRSENTRSKSESSRSRGRGRSRSKERSRSMSRARSTKKSVERKSDREAGRVILHSDQNLHLRVPEVAWSSSGTSAGHHQTSPLEEDDLDLTVFASPAAEVTSSQMMLSSSRTSQARRRSRRCSP